MKAFLATLILAIAVLAHVQEAQAGVMCATCKTVVAKVEEWVESNQTVSWIENELEQLCNILPDSLTPVCDKIIAIGIQDVIAWIEANESPDHICTDLLHICTAEPESKVLCNACEMIVGSIEEWLGVNKTINEIEQLLDQLCSDLGGIFETVCDRIVDQGLQQIIIWLNNNYNPEEVCTMLGLCPAPQPEPENAFFCDTCKVLVSTIEGWVLSNKTVTEMEVMLEELCALLGKTFEPICDRMVVIGIEEIVSWIENNEGPDQICTQLGLCPMPKPAPKDSFWCEACHVLITVLEDWIEANKTITEIEDMLDQLCALLGTPFEEVCDAIIDVGIHKVIEWINVYENPTVVCQQLGLCPVAAVAVEHN